jgi:hypothetical protein
MGRGFLGFLFLKIFLQEAVVLTLNTLLLAGALAAEELQLLMVLEVLARVAIWRVWFFLILDLTL